MGKGHGPGRQQVWPFGARYANQRIYGKLLGGAIVELGSYSPTYQELTRSLRPMRNGYSITGENGDQLGETYGGAVTIGLPIREEVEKWLVREKLSGVVWHLVDAYRRSSS